MDFTGTRGPLLVAGPPGPTGSPPRPAAVTIAFVALVAAVGCGIAETAVRSAETLLTGHAAGPGSLATGWFVRAVVYSVVLGAGWRMLRGDHRARLALTGGIGVFGSASLLAEPIAMLSTTGSGAGPTADVSGVTALVVIIRAGHICAVLVAVPAMYTPAARTWFRALRKAPVGAGSAGDRSVVPGLPVRGARVRFRIRGRRRG